MITLNEYNIIILKRKKVVHINKQLSNRYVKNKIENRKNKTGFIKFHKQKTTQIC